MIKKALKVKWTEVPYPGPGFLPFVKNADRFPYHSSPRWLSSTIWFLKIQFTQNFQERHLLWKVGCVTFGSKINQSGAALSQGWAWLGRGHGAGALLWVSPTVPPLRRLGQCCGVNPQRPGQFLEVCRVCVYRIVPNCYGDLKNQSSDVSSLMDSPPRRKWSVNAVQNNHNDIDNNNSYYYLHNCLPN